MGEAGEGQMITHQQKKMGLEALRKFRDRFAIPVADANLNEIPFLSPPLKVARSRGICRSGGSSLAGACPSDGGNRHQLRVAGAFGILGTACQHRRTRNFHHHGVRPYSQYAFARQGNWQVRRADRSG